jgi:hypothetical protein
LETQGFSATRWHDGKRVAAIHDGANDFFLTRTKVVKPENLGQGIVNRIIH